MIVISALMVAILVKKVDLMEQKFQTPFEFEAVCKNVTRFPFFEDRLVVDTTWRTFYTWNMMMTDSCMDMVFKKVSYEIIERYQSNMQNHLDIKSDWFRANLVMSVSREILLIPDDTVSRIGRFIGIPYIQKKNVKQIISSVPTFKLALKLFAGGRYLIIADCTNGITSFLARKDQPHTKREIKLMISTLDFGNDGYWACQLYSKQRDKVDAVDFGS